MRFRASHLLVAVLLSAGAIARAAEQRTPKVGVLVEPGMVTYGGIRSIPPDRVVPLLRKHGLPAAARARDGG